MEKLVIGKTIKIPCMRRGLVKYTNETILVNQDALEKLAKTSYGIPVVIEHPGIKIDSENLKELPIVGRVADMHYNGEKDEWEVHFVIDTQEAIDLLEKGWGVSTAWFGDDYGAGGTYNNIAYDRELLEGRYEHLAIVEHPRYEMAKGPIFYNSIDKILVPEVKKDDNINSNSQKNGGKKMFGKIFRTIREEIKCNENEDFEVEVDGKNVPLANILDEMKTMESKKNAEPEKKTLSGEDLIEYNGEKITVNELVKRYNELKTASVEPEKEEKENAEPKKEEKAEKEETPEEKEETPEEKEEKAKTNSRFESMEHTHQNSNPEVDESQFVTLRERTDAGRKAYGSK